MNKGIIKLNKTSLLLVVIGFVCIVVALCGLYGTYKEYKDAEDKYNKVEEEFVQQIGHGNEEETLMTENESNDSETETKEETPKIPWYEHVSVDLAGLQSKYSEVVGWLYFENVAISYPLMQAADNNKYLRMAYDGSYSKAGSIFVEATHKSDFSEIHTLIYGHNQKDANMFGKLTKYYDYAWYTNSHKYFQIFSEDKIYRYKIFACQAVEVDSFVFRETPVSASTWANKLKEISIIKSDVVVNDGDRIVTLCTCTDDTKKRILVSAVLVGTYDRTEHTLIQN